MLRFPRSVPSARVEEPLTATLDRRAADIPPRVVERPAELFQDDGLLRVQDEVRDMGGKCGQEGERGEAEFLREGRSKMMVFSTLPLSAGKEKEPTAAAASSRSRSGTERPFSTFDAMLLIEFSSSAGTSLTKIVNASITSARSAMSGKSRDVIKSGSSLGNSVRVSCFGMCRSRVESATR